MKPSLLLFYRVLLLMAATRHAACLPSPWWNDASLVRHPIDPDFDWSQRDTGVSPEGEEAYLTEWTHYNRTGLSHAPVLPWTQGRLFRQLHANSPTSFTLINWFEASAIGHWMGGPHAFPPQRSDGLYEQAYTFHQTPYRITQLPVKLPKHWPSEAATSRVTLCGRGVVSGPRWLPNDEDQSAELLRGDYERLEFAELWLTINNNNKEQAKVGLFVDYDGCTGELKQVFFMRQATASLPFESLDATQASLEGQQLWPVLATHHNAAEKAFYAQTCVSDFLQKRHWKLHQGVCVQLESPGGASFQVEINDAYTTDALYQLPITDEEAQELYFDVRLPDGLFAIFPKTLHPTHVTEDICIELGCVTEDGLQRILLFGKRSRGGLDRCVYESWGGTQ